MIPILNRCTGAVLRAVQSDTLSEADLSGANLSGADLREANLSGANCLTCRGEFLRLAGTRHPIIAIGAGNISIGCHRRTLAEWFYTCEETGRAEGYTPVQIAEYRRHLDYVAEWLAARDAVDPVPAAAGVDPGKSI